ncbi:GntR family transcriptional regulator [Roseovarius sp. ZX-A-9]|uniref:GntR family transcriptional regulator n=1 Tax=Roseovarius sp. ZX-A-9 TaxID=3014783 RepID=UPI00232D46F8|nr:GntR family transcriptional regulator [Roseovarius sp. ZX-A-9]
MTRGTEVTEKALIHAITRKSLHEELVERLQQLIISGDLAPGTKVPEKELCERFDVSRTPMREALKVLASDGLVRLEPNRGAWVTRITASEVEEIFPVLGALEALAGELACAHISDKEIRAVRSAHDQMIVSYESGDLDAYFRLNQQIHRMILLAARNDTLTTACQALSMRMQRPRYLANMSDRRWANAMREHEGIITLLEARDGKKLGAALAEHIKGKQASVLDFLAAETDAQAM